MTVRTAFVRSLFVLLLGLAGGVALAPAAHAQHVVTDDEAGKLTFDALTATPRPVVRHVAYRPVYHSSYRIARASASRYVGRSAPLVQTVAYRRAGHAAAHAAPASVHRRRRG